MLQSTLEEARRQVHICNACRYCEGYCDVFPAITQKKRFLDSDLTHLAHLCHNCRGCYYACQYTDPHEFDVNIPQIFAKTRRYSWETFAYPQIFARWWQRSSVALAVALTLCITFLMLLIVTLQGSGQGFYAHLSHQAMIALFIPASILPLFSLGVSLTRYWRHCGGASLSWDAIHLGLKKSLSLKNLSGGHGQGCYFEKAERSSQARKWAHHLIFYGFLLCFGSTTSGAILHYIFDQPAPYGFWSLPKLLGVPGGVALSLGCLWMMWLKTFSDKRLEDEAASEYGFVLLLFATAASGLLLYAFQGQGLLAFHLGAVLAFFITAPFTKMAHGLYRLTALIAHESNATPVRQSRLTQKK